MSSSGHGSSSFGGGGRLGRGKLYPAPRDVPAGREPPGDVPPRGAGRRAAGQRPDVHRRQGSRQARPGLRTMRSAVGHHPARCWSTTRSTPCSGCSPEDRKLRGLAELTSPSLPTREALGTSWSRSELVAYTPEKAATARWEDASGRVVGFAKVQVGHEGRRSVDALRAARRGVANDGSLRLPDAVAYLPERHLALFTPAPGRPLHELPQDRWPEAMAALGAGLSVLHRQPVDGFAPFMRLDPGWSRRRGRGAATGAPGPGSTRAEPGGDVVARTSGAGRTGAAARRPPPQERAGARRRDQPRRPRPSRGRTGRGRGRRHAGPPVVPAPGRRDHGRDGCCGGRRVPRVVRAGSRPPGPALVRRRGTAGRAGGARRPPGRHAHPGGAGGGARHGAPLGREPDGRRR